MGVDIDIEDLAQAEGRGILTSLPYPSAPSRGEGGLGRTPSKGRSTTQQAEGAGTRNGGGPPMPRRQTPSAPAPSQGAPLPGVGLGRSRRAVGTVEGEATLLSGGAPEPVGPVLGRDPEGGQGEGAEPRRHCKRERGALSGGAPRTAHMVEGRSSCLRLRRVTQAAAALACSRVGILQLPVLTARASPAA